MKHFFSLTAALIFTCNISLTAGDINVTPDMDIKTAIEGAAQGDVIILGDGNYEGELTINLTKNITIKAANNGSAVLSKFQFVVPADAIVDNVTIDGLSAKYDPTIDGKYFLQINTATSNVKNLTIKNCYIYGYGRGVIRATTTGAIIENIIVDNCIFESNSITSAGYANINTQKSSTKSVIITNTTFYNSQAAVFRYEGTETINFLFEKCTVLKCGSASGRKMIEVGSSVTDASVFKIKDCIFSGTYGESVPENKPIDFRSKGDIENSLLEGFSEPLTSNVTETNPVSGTVSVYDYSQLTLTTEPLSISGIGDPRWSLNPGASSIESVETDKKIKTVLYYNMLGQQLINDVNGLAVEQIIYEDGSSDSRKVIK